MNARTPFPNIEDAVLLGCEVERARALVEQQLGLAGGRSAAEMLEELRRTFPHSPLAVRVRALEALRRRGDHIPR
jgi:hypothetical protein